MRALFITTLTSDTHNHVFAWDSINDTPADRVTFNYLGFPTDGTILETAEGSNPDVMFYIGACSGPGLPSTKTFRKLREIAPLINLISDAGDPPWHNRIALYRKHECFDLHVGIDGCPDSPVDLATLTPVDWRAWERPPITKDIHCGFSGNASGKRATFLGALGSRCFVRVRGEDYADHVSFMQRCRFIFNTSYTGSGKYYHVKGRVVEAGWAGGALLEHAYSPMKPWFDSDCYFAYKTAEDAISIIEDTPDDEILARAAALQKTVKKRYHPSMIYGEILEKANFHNPFKGSPS